MFAEATDKITSFFGVERAGDVIWVSRVNTREILEKYTQSPDIMMLEGDVLYVPEAGGVVMTHQFDQEIDLTFREWVKAILKAGKGAKVDLKQLRSRGRPPVEACLEMLAEMWDPEVPLVLNADLFVGPGGDKSAHVPVDPQWFPRLCSEYCNRHNPNALLSLGWVIEGCSDKMGYTDEMIDQILQVARRPVTLSLAKPSTPGRRDEVGRKQNLRPEAEESRGLSGLGGFTFPIKACYIRDSWERIQRLLEDLQHTLTIWSHGEALSDDLEEWLRSETDPDRTFYDLADPKGFTPIRLWRIDS